METEPMHSSGSLGCWATLPWLRGLTTEATQQWEDMHQASSVQDLLKGYVKCGHGGGVSCRGSKLASHT